MKKLKSPHGIIFQAFLIVTVIFSMFGAFAPVSAEIDSPSVTDPFGGLVNSAPKTITNTLTGEGFDFSSIIKSLSGIGEGLGSFAKGLFSKFDQVFSGFSNIFGNFFSSLFSSANQIFGSLTSFGDMSSSSLSQASSSSSGGSSSSASASSSDASASSSSGAAGGGSASAQKVVQCAEKYINSTKFRGAEVNFGNKACAQFVSTALKDAGVLANTILGVPALVTALKSKGYAQVTAPPFKGGDIVTWRTYDRSGDGRKDDDTHVGIMCFDGKAIANSSSARMPKKNDVYYAPICKVLRKS